MRRLLALYIVIVPLLFGAFSALQQHQAQACLTLTGAGPPCGIPSGGCPGGTTTWDPVNIGSNWTLSGGNLTATYTAGTSFAWSAVRSLANHSTGKYYAEFTPTNGSWPNTYSASVGLVNASNNLSSQSGVDTTSAMYFNGSGNFQINNVNVSSTMPTYVSGNVVGEAVDIGGQLIWYRVNAGSWNGSGTANPATGIGGLSLSTMAAGPYYAAAYIIGDNPNPIWTANFGATSYGNAAPSGFCNW